MIRQASDLASKFVGETEQNMARMFEEAQSEAVPLLDEADSFCGRRMAERHHEVTEVNEMLQGMERFWRRVHLHHQPVRRSDEAALASLHLRAAPLRALLGAQRERMFVLRRWAARRSARATKQLRPGGCWTS